MQAYITHHSGLHCENKAPFGAINYYHEYARQQRMGFSASYC
jgi:hypothetical protein